MLSQSSLVRLAWLAWEEPPWSAPPPARDTGKLVSSSLPLPDPLPVLLPLPVLVLIPVLLPLPVLVLFSVAVAVLDGLSTFSYELSELFLDSPPASVYTIK